MMSLFQISPSWMRFIWLFTVLLPKIGGISIKINSVYAKLFYTTFSFNLCGRPLFITCICLDCYMAVVHPVTYRVRKSLTPRVSMAVGVWAVTLTYGYYVTTIESAILTDPTMILFFSLTLPVIGFCDFSILWTLKRSNPGGGEVHPQKKKALQIIINNLVVTFTSYFPPIIVCLFSKCLHFDDLTIQCLMMIPMMGITNLGNSVSLILHLNNLGKLDWLKCWQHKWTSFNLCFVRSVGQHVSFI